MKYLNILIFVQILSFISCNDKPSKKMNTLIYLSNSEATNKDKLVELLNPIEKSDTNYIFYPIEFVRVDRNNESFQADYMKKELNYNKISPVKREFKSFFNSIELDSAFYSISLSNPNFSSYSSLKNSFIYNPKALSSSENIYNDANKLKDAIVSFSKTNSEKIVIVFNPTIQNAIVETPKPLVADVTTASASSVVTSTKVVKETTTTTKSLASSPCPNKITCSGIDDCFKKLADANIPRDCKAGLKSQAINYFESSSSKVVNVNNNGDRIAGEWSISSYCDRLMTTHRPTFVYGKESNGSKISILKINP